MVRALVAVSLIAGSCYTPRFEPCTVRCGPGAACPAGYVCSPTGDGYCHEQGQPTPECPGCSLQTIALGAGQAFSCAVMAKGIEKKNPTAWCWGANGTSQLGNGNELGGELPRQVVTSPGGPALHDVVEIHGGLFHACALIADDSLYCWGENTWGQLGTGDTGSQPSPVRVPLPAVKAFALGDEHTCAVLKATGTLWCWGRNDDGRAGGTVDSVLAPAQVGTVEGIKAVAAGDDFSCFLVGDAVSCFGANDFGQLGNGTDAGSRTPVALQFADAPAGAVKTLRAGKHHACTVADATLYCWGEDTLQLLTGQPKNSDRAVKVVRSDGTPFGNAGELAVGAKAICVTQDSAVYCWGHNSLGQLGTNDGLQHLFPTPLGIEAVELATAGQHTCARLPDAGVLCWGNDANGQVGVPAPPGDAGVLSPVAPPRINCRP